MPYVSAPLDPGLAPRVVSGIVTVAELAVLLRHLRRREARQHRAPALTYRELAAKTGWSRGIIGEYFGGRVLPPTDRFDVLIGLLGATPDEQHRLATVRDRIEEARRAGRAAGGDPIGRQTPCRHILPPWTRTLLSPRLASPDWGCGRNCSVR